MYELADLSLGQTLSGLVQLASLRILRETGLGFEFANELLRAEVYASVSSPLRRALHGSIADRLLALEPTMDVSGLEIAWHCVRAGRPQEALPYLLSGARQAMRQGAAHLAQRALETAMPGIGGINTIVEAKLLLVEALQEQGRWRDSLDLLRSMSGIPGEPRMYADTLEARALQSLGSHFLAELQGRLPQLLSIVREATNHRSRVLAAQALAYLAADVRDQELAKAVLQDLDGMLEDVIDEDTASQRSLARVLLLKMTGQAAQSEDLVKGTIDSLKKSGTTNLVTIRLFGVLGTLNTCEGRYDEAIVNFKHCHSLATRAGIDTMAASMAGNIALSYGRLGDYNQQLDWATRAPNAWGGDFGGFVEVQIAYCKGMSHGMRGRVKDVQCAIEELEQRMELNLPPWIQQAWQLWKADLLMLTGSRAEALAAGRLAATRFGGLPLTSSFVGAFDRWLAATTQGEKERAEARRLIKTHLNRLHEFDSVDQVEILCADLQAAKAGLERIQAEGVLRERVRYAAPGLVSLLQRLEVIPA
jgi:tetratricopeptide (TPR) repeat protein